MTDVLHEQKGIVRTTWRPGAAHLPELGGWSEGKDGMYNADWWHPDWVGARGGVKVGTRLGMEKGNNSIERGRLAG